MIVCAIANPIYFLTYQIAEDLNLASRLFEI
jgi:hypothetical protein